MAVSFIGGRNQEYPKKTTELSQVTDYYKMKILKNFKCFLPSDISNETNNVPFAFPVCKNMNFVLMRIFCLINIVLMGSHYVETVSSCLPIICIKHMSGVHTKSGIDFFILLYHKLYAIDNMHFRQIETKITSFTSCTIRMKFEKFYLNTVSRLTQTFIMYLQCENVVRCTRYYIM